MNLGRPLCTVCVFVGRGLVAFNMFALACMGLGQGRWYLEGTWYWIPCYAGLSAIGVICCMSGRSRRWATMGAICLLTNAALLTWAYAPWTRRPELSHAANFRILTANVYRYNRDAGPLLDLIRETNPDIVLLQEVDEAWVRRLAPLESIYPHRRIVPRYPNGGPDLAQYARFALEDFLALAESGIPAASMTVRVKDIAVRVVNVHTAAPFSPRRADHYYAQMRMLADLATHSKQPTVLAGDLNSSPWSPAYRMLVRATGLADTQRGSGILGTWPSFFGPFRTPLDHALASPGIEVVDSRVGPGIGSDHRPLLIDLRVAPKMRPGAMADSSVPHKGPKNRSRTGAEGGHTNMLHFEVPWKGEVGSPGEYPVKACHGQVH